MTNNDIKTVGIVNDGSPLTYDTINEIITTVNQLVNRTNELDNANTAQQNYSNIKVEGFGASIKSLKIVVGKADITKAQISNQFKIEYSDFSSIPKIIAMVRETKPNETQQVIYASVALLTITKNQATMKLNFVKTPQSPVTVDYIAIGPA